jgi:Undecaprenyl-phosphate glucose phosphotransferase
MRFQTRLYVLAFLAVDLVSTNLAWLLAYALRFHAEFLTGVIPVTKGVPPLSRYVLLLPVISVLWPAVMYFHGLYRVRRSRSHIDELFAILFSVLTAAGLMLGLTLFVRVYYRYQPEVAPLWEYSRGVFALFVFLDVGTIYGGRFVLRRRLESMWAAGRHLRRVLIAGAGELGRAVARTIADHRELGYRVVGFLDDRATDPIDGVPVLGPLSQAAALTSQKGVDELYVALPFEEHGRALDVIGAVSNECVDIKLVPDLLQYASMKAALEDLDGIPIIGLNEVPLRGWNSMVKRVMDVVVGSACLVLLSVVVPLFPVIALLIRWRGGPGPVLLRQERMTLDGKTFQIFKFRTMVDEAEKDTGPVFAREDDPRRTTVGIWLRRFNLDELPQLLNVVLGDMSLVGPRPERPPFVRQFKERIPQYMLRHRVKSGITGWAQVNGWRGNSSIEKRIEFDLYYIENWSLLLDVKILILTLFRGFGQKHAY